MPLCETQQLATIQTIRPGVPTSLGPSTGEPLTAFQTALPAGAVFTDPSHPLAAPMLIFNTDASPANQVAGVVLDARVQSLLSEIGPPAAQPFF